MPLNINKPRPIAAQGLSGLSVSSPVSKIDRAQMNDDGTTTVIVNFFADQAAMDDENGRPFETASFQINTPVNFENQINVELKKLDDFDAAT